VQYDPADDGRWYACGSCGFHGDSIELYQKAKNVPTLHETIYRLAGQQIISASSFEITNDQIVKYSKQNLDRRVRADEFWDKAQKRAAVLESETLELMQHYHLWAGYRGGHWQEGIGRFIGVADRKELERFGIRLPPRGYYMNLVLAYHDVFGRISAFRFLPALSKTLDHKLSAGHDAGLLMLDTTNIRDDTVLAIGDPMFALHLQRMYLSTRAKALQIVSWNSDTLSAWRSLHARQVIFWDRRVGYELFRQCRRYPNAFIATRPQTSGRDPLNYFHKYSSDEIIDRMRASSQPWHIVFKEWALSVEHAEAAECIAALQLKPSEIDLVLDSCTRREEGRLRAVLGDIHYEHIVQVGKLRVDLAGDEWVIIGNDRSRELGSDTKLFIDYAIQMDSGKSYYSGRIVKEGKEYNFVAPMQDVKKGTAGWFDRTCMEMGIHPVIAKRLQASLLDLAFRAQKPQHIWGVERVGWHSNVSAWVLPTFAVREGGIDVESQRFYVEDGKVPAEELPPPLEIDKKDWRKALSDRPEWAGVWATLACLMSNMLASARGEKPKSIGVVGGPGSIGALVLQLLRDGLGMITVSDRATLDDATNRHDYPVYIEPGKKTWREIDANDSLNVIAPVSEGVAAALSVGDGWVFVDCSQLRRMEIELSNVYSVFRFLAYMQASDLSLPMSTSLQLATLERLQDWIYDHEGLRKPDTVFKKAAEMLHGDDEALEKRTLDLIFWLYTLGRLELKRKPFVTDLQGGGAIDATRFELLLDEDADRYFVSIKAIRSAMEKLGLPNPDLDAASVAFGRNAGSKFELCGDGWMFAREFWERAFEQYRAQRQG
jgi:hypothetical protein